MHFPWKVISCYDFVIKTIYLCEALVAKRDSRCPFCKNLNKKIVFKKAGLIDICFCNACGLYWTNPIFRFYRFYDLLYRDVAGLRGCLDKEKIVRSLSTQFRDSDIDCTGICDWLKKIAPGNKLLEFGSSWGFFLYQAQCAGFEVKGVDISKKKAALGRELLRVNIVTDINDVVARRETYDIIFSTHTLEHLGYEISSIFEKFYTLLKNNGMIVLSVPFIIPERIPDTFTVLGARHPLGFTKEFFILNLPKHHFKVTYVDNNFVCAEKELYQP